MDIPIRHDKEGRRFVADLADATAELTYLFRDATTVIFNHTYVPPSGRGTGVAAALAARALEWARASGFGVVPVCSYVAMYMQRHREYEDLLAR
jgi:predicted GNAT family acetyltransferase